MITISPHRRWLTFSLRTMFALLTLAAVLLGWFAYSTRWILQRHQFLESRVRNYCPYEQATQNYPWVILHRKPAPGSLRLFGESGIAFMALRHSIDRPTAVRLFPEAKIWPAEGGIAEFTFAIEEMNGVPFTVNARSENSAEVIFETEEASNDWRANRRQTRSPRF